MKIITASLAIAALMVSTAIAQTSSTTSGTDSSTTTTTTDGNEVHKTTTTVHHGHHGADHATREFIHDAALGGMGEVELGKLAVEKASDDKVKQFAQKMVDDHTKANSDLQTVAMSENISVPTQLGQKELGARKKLSQQTGTKFDQMYIKMMLEDHQKDVSDFQNQANNGTDPAVKNFAAATLPTLQEHLQMVQQLAGK